MSEMAPEVQCSSGLRISADAAFELAERLLEDRRIEPALTYLDLAESLGACPNRCGAHRWFCHMLGGRFEQAWRASERIRSSGAADPNALWDGRPFHGRRVMVRCLHGFGDAIQFIRYARLVRCEAAAVTVQTHPELVPLMRCVPGVDRAITWPEEDRSLWDQQIEVMELPFAFRTTLEDIPADIPYIDVPAARRLRTRVPPDAARPRIGLQWAAGDWDPARSVALSALARLTAAAPGANWFSFQRGAAREDLRGSAFAHASDVSGDSPDILEAAADLLNIDLLITVDTMLAHLAGALGRPVWLLLQFCADWRWMLGRSDSPWYPSMRLFRQSRQGDWSDPIEEIAVALRRRAA